VIKNIFFSAFQKTNEVAFLFWNRVEISGSSKCYTENSFSYQWSIPFDAVNQTIIQICVEKEAGTVQFITSCTRKGSDLKSTEVATNTKKKTRVFNFFKKHTLNINNNLLFYFLFSCYFINLF
jgi:hypothetical protein